MILLRAAMLSIALLLLAAPARGVDRDVAPVPHAATRVIPDTVRFDQEIADGNLVQMTVTNYGFYGNNFFNRTASLEYPAGRGYEHLVRGGLWVGGHATDENGEFDGVTSGTVDAAQGATSPQSSEWTPGDRQITRRSTLSASVYYDTATAVSEMDLVSHFNDFTPTQAASNAETHRPMQLEVRQETYQWNYAEFKNSLFVRTTITNRGPLITNMWIGFYAEMASGTKGAYVNWPPSSGDPGGQGSWFNNKWLYYDEENRMLREHYCDQMQNYNETGGCLLERAPYWIGVRYLGSRGLVGDDTPRQLSVSAWNWSPGNVFRDQDSERFRLMNTGLIQPLDGDSTKPGTGDPTEILSVGPFPLVYRDSSITIDFAVVGGSEVADIQHNSKFAQFAYDHDYILPGPPDPPNVKVVPRDGAVDIYWTDSPEYAYDVTSPSPCDFEGYRIYVGEDPDTLAMVGQFDLADTSGFNTGLDAVRIPPGEWRPPPAGTYPPPKCPGTPSGPANYTYKYTIGNLRNGFKYYVAVNAYDIGNTQIAPYESGLADSLNRFAIVPGAGPGERGGRVPTVFPNPYRVEARWDQGRLIRDHYLWFANLPPRCLLRIYTLSGDMVFEKEFDGSDYHGEGARGIFDPRLPRRVPELSGTSFGWDLITREGQAAATGLYLFAVEDRATGDRHVGKFLVVKSDREAR